MDNRSKEQFAEDIQKSSRVEREIIDRFAEQYQKENDVILLILLGEAIDNFPFHP